MTRSRTTRTTPHARAETSASARARARADASFCTRPAPLKFPFEECSSGPNFRPPRVGVSRWATHFDRRHPSYGARDRNRRGTQLRSRALSITLILAALPFSCQSDTETGNDNNTISDPQGCRSIHVIADSDSDSESFTATTETSATDTGTDTDTTTAADTTTATNTTTSTNSATATIPTDSDSTTRAVCGDGTQEGDEACDNGEGNGPGKQCSSECTLNTCGNSMIDQDEECDKGDDNADDAICTSECTKNVCGDGLVLAGENPEECDKGDMNGAGQDCLEDCTNNLCGNGPDNGLDDGEECDDGNRVDDDGCSSTCTIEHRLVFVTSIPFPGNLSPGIGDLSGLPLADAHCQELAAAVKVEPGTFMAWLSDGKDGPSTRFGLAGPGFTGVFELATGTPIADGWADLTDGMLEVPIDVDEDGQAMQSSTVWTNTNIDGTPTGDQHCDGWTSVDANGGAGKCNQATMEWTEAITENACSNRPHCFQVTYPDRPTSLAHLPPPHRLRPPPLLRLPGR